MKKLNTIVIWLLFLITIQIHAQQEASFTQYRYHMNIVNPAYVAMNNETTISSTLRDQWTGVPYAPLTQAVSFGTPVEKKIGLGLSMVNNKNFVEKQTLATIDFSYKIQLNETIDLYLGIKAGGDFYNQNTSGLKIYNIQQDPALETLNTFTPNFGLGTVLKGEKFFISFSSPRILNTERVRNEVGYATLATDKMHLYASGGYDFDLNLSTTALILKPSVMMRYVKNAPISIDLTTMLEIGNVFEIGAMYRTDKAYGVLVDFKINQRLLVGYSYEWSARNTLGSDQNTYELLLQYKF